MTIEKTLPKNFWKKKLKIEEYELVTKLPVDNLTLKEQFNHYYLHIKKLLIRRITIYLFKETLQYLTIPT